MLLSGWASVALAASLQVAAVDQAPVDPWSTDWAKAAPVDVTMLAQQVAYPKNMAPDVATVTAKALADAKYVVVRVEWADPTKDEVVDVDRLTDGVAIELPLGDPATANPMMGGPGAPVYLCNWKAAWQKDVEHGHADVQDQHPDMYADAYPFAKGEAPYPIDGGAFEGTDARRYFVATSAGNPVAALTRQWPVEELAAEGFGTLASQALQDARGWGAYKDGHWAVVIAVPRRTDDPQNPVLAPGTKSAVAFAVWEGGAENVGGRKHWSGFTELVLP